MRRAETIGLATGAIGLLAAMLGWAVDAHAFHAAWLSAMVLVAAWPLGSIALLLTHALTGGRWGEALRPALLTGIRTLPLLVIAAIPWALGLHDIYPWAHPGAQAPNAFYLNVPFLAARGALYFIVWLALGAAILRGRAAGIAAPGLFLLAVVTSFAAIDTTMSLDPHFTSSIYGMMTACGMALFALSMAILLSAAGDTVGDLGKLLLSLIVLWVYLDFMQLLIVWQSDLAHDSPWYLLRSRGIWGAVAAAIAIGHFVLPLALLISPRLQRSRRVVSGIAALLVAMAMLRAWWTVLPSMHLSIGWIDIACMAGLGGATLSFALWAARYRLERRLRHV